MMCADAIGFHFVAVPQYNDVTQNIFTKGFRTIVQHKNPVNTTNIDRALQEMKTICDTGEYPWANPNALIFKAIDKVIPRTEEAYNIFLENIYNVTRSQVLADFSILNVSLHSFAVVLNDHLVYKQHVHSSVDLHNYTVPLSHRKARTPHKKRSPLHLPLIPNVAITMRCSDTLTATWPKDPDYGFMNWNLIASLIPNDAEHIYILSEPLDYSGNKLNIKACIQIGDTFVNFLLQHFPNATVAIRRGYPNDGLVALGFAPIVICNPTTYCLFPALNNPGKNEERS